jgi:hypothetical protein
MGALRKLFTRKISLNFRSRAQPTKNFVRNKTKIYKLSIILKVGTKQSEDNFTRTKIFEAEKKTRESSRNFD